MGCYNMQCNLTGMSILEGDETIGIPIIFERGNPANARCGEIEIDSAWKPLGFVLHGKYSDYGYIENVKSNQNVDDFKKIYDITDSCMKTESWEDFAKNMERSLVSDEFFIKRKDDAKIEFEDLTEKEQKEIEKDFGSLSFRKEFADEVKNLIEMQIKWSGTASDARQYGDREYVVSQMLIHKGFIDKLKNKIPEEFVKGYVKSFCRNNPQLAMVVAKIGVDIDLEYVLYFMSKAKVIVCPSMYGSQTSWEAMDVARAEFVMEHHKKVFEKQKSTGYYFEECEEEGREPTFEDYLKIRKDWWMKDEL